MNCKTEAIVLHSIKYGDSRLIVDMFTREHGRLSFGTNIPKSGHAKIKKQYFQPLTLLYIEADVRQQQQVHKLKDVSMLCPIASLLTDPSKLAIALFIAEFLYHAMKDEQTNTPLFDYIRSSIEWLDNRQDHYANFHLVFLIHLSRFLGFFPNLSKEERSKEGRSMEGWSKEGRSMERRSMEGSNEIRGEGVYFDLRAATFCTTPPPHHDYLMPEEAGHIALIMRMDYATMHLFRLSRAERNRILEIVEHYYRLHLPAFPELRSLPVLRELFD